MSDAGRKDWSDKLKEGVQPDSSKSTPDKFKENVTDIGDKMARSGQPSQDKSAGQKAADSFGRSKDQGVHGSTGDSILDKAKGALGMDKK